MPPLVVLIGAPGSGKSSVGRQLAKLTNSEFVDTDALIEAAEGKKISDIFVENGEPYFREVEKKVVLDTLNSKDAVVSLGGGSILNQQVQEKLEPMKDKVIFLEVSISNAAPRVGFNKERPLLVGNPRAKWQTLMEERRPIYERLATTRISTDNKKPLQVAQEIAQALKI